MVQVLQDSWVQEELRRLIVNTLQELILVERATLGAETRRVGAGVLPRPRVRGFTATPTTQRMGSCQVREGRPATMG